jgi:hypothetical protein
MKKQLFSIYAIFAFVLSVSAQDVQTATATLSYTPKENGYEVYIPFRWKFIDCDGVHVTIERLTKEMTSNTYIYKGVRYTANQLGSDAFSKIKEHITLVDVYADVYNGPARLGNVKLNNIVGWFGGCFGETHPVIKLLALKDADFKNQLGRLSLQNLRMEVAYTINYELEGRIREMEKKESADKKVADADRQFAANNLEQAAKLYEDALKDDPNNESARQKLKEIADKTALSKKNDVYNQYIKKGNELLAKGDYRGAKAAFENALETKPNDAAAKSKMADAGRKFTEAQEQARQEQAQAARQIQQREEQAKEQESQNSQARVEAGKRRHTDFFWGQGEYPGASAGSETQQSHLIGNFRLDYDIWLLSGEPAFKFRFYWEWDNHKFSGYPIWFGISKDAIEIKNLKQYPDLMDRWNKLKPEYIEIKCEISGYWNSQSIIAHEGTIKIIPENIGYSGQEIAWSSPSSANWNELFTYCNDLNVDFFKRIGVYDDMRNYGNSFGSGVASAKFAFENSDKIDFFQSGHRGLSSVYKELTQNDKDNYSTSAKIDKVVWNSAEILAIIEEYKKRDKLAREEKSLSFWNSPENDNKKQADDFWNSSENTLTQQQKKANADNANSLQEVEKTKERRAWGRNKYAALGNLFQTKPANNETVETEKLDFNISMNAFMRSENARVELRVGNDPFYTTQNGSQFSSKITLKEGWNTVVFTMKTSSFGITDSVKIFFKKPLIDMPMVFVQGGSVQIEGRRAVSVSSFYIGKYEVTQQQWETIVGSNPSHFRGENLPVEQISLNGAFAFVDKLNELTGKKYSLPSEEEWQYAASGGNQSRGYTYSGSSSLGDVAWYSSNSTHPVGLKQPNELGIFDMSGNVLEWTLSGNTFERCRGGSFISKDVDECSVIYQGPTYHANLALNNFLGFRVIMHD